MDNKKLGVLNYTKETELCILMADGGRLMALMHECSNARIPEDGGNGET